MRISLLGTKTQTDVDRTSGERAAEAAPRRLFVMTNEPYGSDDMALLTMLLLEEFQIHAVLVTISSMVRSAMSCDHVVRHELNDVNAELLHLQNLLQR